MGKLVSSFITNNTPHTLIVKSKDQSIISQDTNEDDSELFFQAEANKTYIIKLFLLVNSPANANFDHLWSIPAGATAGVIKGNWDTDSIQTFADWAVIFEIGTGGTDESTATWGKIITGATRGLCQWQWTQSVSQASNTTVQQGTMLQVYES